jgi:RNA polymerase sigma-70 factor, ECF subfamily
MLHYDAGMLSQDCPRQMAATVKTRLHRARKLIRAELADSLASALAGSFPFAGARCAQVTNAVLARLGI